MSSTCYCLSVRTGCFLSIAWSVGYSIVQVAYVITQVSGVHHFPQSGKNKLPVFNITKKNVSLPHYENLPSIRYPSVLLPEGWNEDVVSHIHLLLLVVYLTVLISCIILVLGIFLVEYAKYKSVILTLYIRIV